MKKYLYIIILSFLINSVALARSTGCKEGNCEKILENLLRNRHSEIQLKISLSKQS